MSFQAAFHLSSYLLIVLGMSGLFLTEEISPPYLALSLAGLVLGIARDARGGKALLPPLVQNVILLVVAAHASLSIFVFRELPLLALAEFLLALKAIKLLGQKQAKDWSLLYLLSFFSIVAAAALSVELFFAGIFFIYLFLAPWVLVLAELKHGAEAAGKDPNREPRFLGWHLLRLVGGINIVLFVLTLVLFVVFPRLGVGLFGDAWATGSAVAGFSDRLALGEVAKIQRNGAVAMRVTLDPAPPGGESNLYWRGVALDHFDGRRWQKTTHGATAVGRFGETYRLSSPLEGRAPLVHQKIVLEPTGSPTLFALSKPVMITGRLGYLFLDSMGNLRTLQPFFFQVSYEVLSDLEPGSNEGQPGDNFLQLPDLNPRIASLARQVAAGATDPEKLARALERHLRENFRYSLADLPVGKEDPLAAFLFEVKQGNCEYFASSLAIMLRSLGIPARVVNGYLGGEWNPYGEYYLVRQSNAHSWVEAYLNGKGWVRLDPTPSVPSGRGQLLLNSFTHFADFLRMNWYRYVINFGVIDQYRLFNIVHRPHRWLALSDRGSSLSDFGRRFAAEPRPWAEIGSAMLAAVLLFWAIMKKRDRRLAKGREAHHEATARYRRFLKLCAKKGFIKRHGETPDEFYQRVRLGGNGLTEEFTSLYQQARFSVAPDTTADLKKMDRILRQLARFYQNAQT